MATFYKYKSREGEDQIDWKGITKGISDDLSRVQGEREKKRVEIDNAVLTRLETIADMPLGSDAARNEITADYAAQASAIALENQRLLKTGQMSLKQYNSITNTAGSSTKKLFGLTKKYQENYQRHMDALKPDENGIIQASGLSPLLRQQAEALGDPTNTKYYMDPQSGNAYIARLVGKDKKFKDIMDANIRQIDGKAYSLMDVATAQNIITMDVNRYQVDQVANSIAKRAGLLTEVIMSQGVKTRSDWFERIYQKDAEGNPLSDKDGNKVLSDIGEAVTSQIRASFASPMDYASMLYDTLNKASIAKNDDGTYTNLLTRKKYEGDVKDAVIFETVNSQQVPVLTEAQEKQAQEGVLNIIRSKMGITETAYDEEARENQRRRIENDERKTQLLEDKNKQNQSPEFQDIKLAVNKKIDALDFTGVEFTNEEKVVKELKEMLSPYVDINEEDYDNTISLKIPGKTELKVDLSGLFETFSSGVTAETLKETIKDYITPSNEDDILKYALKYGDLARPNAGKYN